MRRTTTWLFIILLSYLGLVIYANRALICSPFDTSYWKDKYEQSQWKLPLSPRTIGDDGLYLYEGYRLIKGGDPTNPNAEMPPLGKYLIGTSLVLFNNGHVYGLLVTIGLLAATYALARIVLKQTLPAFFVTVLLAYDPLITNQYTLTMMDALQALLLLMFLVLLFRIPQAPPKRLPYLVLALGILLGLFSETKLPVFTPFLALFGLGYLWMHTKKIVLAVFFLCGSGIGYLVPYIVYFSYGHTFLDWLKIQKWILSFYLHTNLTATWGSAITTLLVGRYQNIFSRGWETTSQWSPSWGLLLFMSSVVVVLWIHAKKKDMQWGIVLGILFCILGVYAIIPFWTRYLVLILPLLYITGAYLLTLLPKRIYIPIFCVLLVVNLASSLPVLFPSPQATANQFIYNTERLMFADLYEDTTRAYRNTIDRMAFRRFGLSTMANGEIEQIKITPLSKPMAGRTSPQYLVAEAKYYTYRLGSFTQRIVVPFVLEDGRWRIPWNWSVLLPGLSESRYLETTVDPARRGTILKSDKSALATDVEGFMVSVIPADTDKTQEKSLLSLLETLFSKRLPRAAIHQRIVGNTLPDFAIPIGVIPLPKTDPLVIALLKLPGVTLTPAFARATYPDNVNAVGELKNSAFGECCTHLYSTTNYDGINGVEQSKNEVLKGYNGGTLTLKNQQGITIRTYINVTKSDGKNVEP